MNKCTKSWLRSGLSMLLALCLVFSAPIVALADTADYCNVDEAEAAVATAEKYGPLVDQIVDIMISNFFENADYNEIFVKSLTKSAYKTVIIEEIVGMLDEPEKEQMLIDNGIEPTAENKEKLATAIYDIAVIYHDATANHTENLEAGRKTALVETMEFALVEVAGIADADAELYYSLYETSTASGTDAAVDEYLAAEGVAHNYVEGTCSNCGAEDPDYVPPHEHNYVKGETVPATCTEDGYTSYTCECGDSYDAVIEATGHNYVDGVCSACGAEDPDYVAPTEPEVTEPEATEPEATEPEATEPEATEPEATEPEATEPEATEPEATEPEATEPEATEPETDKPSASDKLKNALKKLIGKIWEGVEKPEEPTEPAPSEPEATEPSEPSAPDYSNIIKSIRDTLKDIFSWLKK